MFLMTPVQHHLLVVHSTFGIFAENNNVKNAGVHILADYRLPLLTSQLRRVELEGKCARRTQRRLSAIKRHVQERQ